jgi:basic membrane protein A and related proteins
MGQKCTILLAALILAAPMVAAADAVKKPLKIGMVTVGPVSDYGYNYAHDQGRLQMQKNLPDAKTTVVEKIPENAEVERVIEKLIAQGNNLIFSTSYGYLEPAQRVAKRHPKTIIMQTWRPAPEANMGMYAAYQYEPLYAVGIVAGRMTKKNSIGFVCAHPVPLLLQNINAFTLGARSVNPKAKVHVVWTNSWSDPPVEAEATKSLIESGVDIIGAVDDSPVTVVQAGERNHVMVFGTQSDLSKLAPTQWIAGSRFNWGPVYTELARSVSNGTWKKGEQWLGTKDGAVGLSSFGKRVPLSVQAEATKALEQIGQNKLRVFAGPLKDRDGKLRLAANQKADTSFLSGMNWFVDGVEGTLPAAK